MQERSRKVKLQPRPPRGDGSDVYRLKITLKGVRPPVWRRVLVPGRITLARLHGVVQVAMAGPTRTCASGVSTARSMAFPTTTGSDPDLRNEARVRLDTVAARVMLRYWYDFGDDWWHDLLVEDVRQAERGERLPRCIGCRRACPPEDAGGPWGYIRFLEAYTDPRHPEHEERVTWAGPYFSPAGFDVAETDRLLRGTR